MVRVAVLVVEIPMDVNAPRGPGQAIFAMAMKKGPMAPAVHRLVRKAFLTRKQRLSFHDIQAILWVWGIHIWKICKGVCS